MAEGVLHFLGGGFLEYFGSRLVSLGAADFCKVHVLDVGHGFAGEGGFDVLDGDGFFHFDLLCLCSGSVHASHLRENAID